MKLRLALLAVVALALSPGTWWRTIPSPPDTSQELNLLPIASAHGQVGPFHLSNVWDMESPHSRFGGYSALILTQDGRFIAGSDIGDALVFSAPDRVTKAPYIGPFGRRKDKDKHQLDLESLTQDSASGRIWAGFESQNAIQRMEGDFTGTATIRPPEMRRWSSNSGPESLVRLDDGRFIVLAEGEVSWRDNTHYGLLFPSDPVTGAEPVKFRFASPDGYKPVDMKQLPDGRALVLLRRLKLGLPPGFESALMLLDPADIAADKLWRGTLLAELTQPLPPENYEGLAIEEIGAGKLALWLISDDNLGLFQRSLLARLEWTPPAPDSTGKE